MIDLCCPKCQSVLPVREDKIGKSTFVCPKCAHPLDAANRAAPLAAWLTEKTDERDPHEATTVGMETAFPDLKRPSQASVGGNGPARTPSTDPPAVGTEAFPNLRLSSGKPLAKPVEKKTKQISATAPRPLRSPLWPPKRWLLIGGAAAGVVCLALALWIVMRPSRTPAAADLLTHLKDPDPQVRARAVQAIADLGPSARPLLVVFLEALKDPDPEVRRLAGEALKQRREPDRNDLPALSLALQDPSPEVRLFAVRAVSQLGPGAKDQLSVLRELEEDENADVGKAAKEALERLSNVELASLMRQLETGSPTQRADAARGLGELGPRARPALDLLLDAATDKKPDIRRSAKEALVRIGPVAVPTLREALTDKNNPGYRQAAVEVLGQMGVDARDLIPNLVVAAEEPALRKVAVTALQNIGRDAVPALVRTLATVKTPAAKTAVKDALVDIGHDALPALKFVEDSSSSTPEIRLEAAEVRARIVDLPQDAGPELTGEAAAMFENLLDLFNRWDINPKDAYLDRQELAVAFRGPAAKLPVLSAPPTTNELDQFPDAVFLARLDRDGDNRISRAEFSRWARDYAVVMSQAANAQDAVDLTYQGLRAKIADAATTSLQLQAQIAATVAKGEVDAALQAQKAANDAALLQEQAVLNARLAQLRAVEEAAVLRWQRWGGPVIGHVTVKNVANVTKNKTTTNNNTTTNNTVNIYRPPHQVVPRPPFPHPRPTGPVPNLPPGRRPIRR